MVITHAAEQAISASHRGNIGVVAARDLPTREFHGLRCIRQREAVRSNYGALQQTGLAQLAGRPGAVGRQAVRIAVERRNAVFRWTVATGNAR